MTVAAPERTRTQYRDVGFPSLTDPKVVTSLVEHAFRGGILILKYGGVVGASCLADDEQAIRTIQLVIKGKREITPVCVVSPIPHLAHLIDTEKVHPKLKHLLERHPAQAAIDGNAHIRFPLRQEALSKLPDWIIGGTNQEPSIQIYPAGDRPVAKVAAEVIKRGKLLTATSFNPTDAPEYTNMAQAAQRCQEVGVKVAFADDPTVGQHIKGSYTILSALWDGQTEEVAVKRDGFPDYQLVGSLLGGIRMDITSMEAAKHRNVIPPVLSKLSGHELKRAIAMHSQGASEREIINSLGISA